MASFTVRVELHDATWIDYDELHKAMNLKAFSRTIVGSDGIRYKLPDAEYYTTANMTKTQVLERARQAANTTGKSYGVFVTESSGCTWIGLEQV